MDVASLVKDALLSQTQRSGQCLNWMGFYSIDKIPRVFIVNRWFDAKVLSYNLFVGEIPAGYKPKPTCGNWACIDPAHLSLIQERETKSTKQVAKIRPRASSVKSQNGSQKGISNKLSPDERQAIIDTFYNTPEDERGGLQAKLAHDNNVTPALVSQLLKAWRERENPLPELAVVISSEEDVE